MATAISEHRTDLMPEVSTTALPYRHVSTLAVGSLVCGALSWLGAYFEWFLLLPLLGIGLGLAALTRIDRFPDELTGVAVAKVGIGLSAMLGLVCFGWHGYLYFADAPPGYYVITYDVLKPLPGAAADDPPPSARELEGKRVFVKGYMYPGRQTLGIERFTLVPSLTHCQFCMPQIKPTEMVDVKLVHGMKTRFTNRRRGVGGIFHIRSPDDKEPGLLYQIQADYLQ